MHEVYSSLMEAVSSAVAALQQERVQSFCLAAATGSVYTLRQIVSSGLDVNSADYDRRTALLVAAAHGKDNCIDFLLASGANVDWVDNQGFTMRPLSFRRCACVLFVLSAHLSLLCP
jgi:hypothetical protein